jgi:hypothetical protein
LVVPFWEGRIWTGKILATDAHRHTRTIKLKAESSKLKAKEFTAETQRAQRCFFFLFSGGQPLKYLASNGYPAFVGPLTGKQKMIKPLRSLRLCGE